MRKLLLSSVLLTTLLSAGCLIGETTHTLYLSPDGSVTWSVLETEIRSDAGEREERRQEEADYLERVFRGEHPVGLALDRLFPVESETRVIRAERPFTVRTDARFRAVDRLAEELLRGLGGVGEARLTVGDGQATFELTIDVLASEEADDQGDEALHPLLGDAEDYRILLTSGRFVAAAGFELQHDGTVAVPLELDEEAVEAAGGVITYSLAWTEK